MLTNLNRLLTTIDDELTPAIVALNSFLAKVFGETNALPATTHAEIAGSLLGAIIPGAGLAAGAPGIWSWVKKKIWGGTSIPASGGASGGTDVTRPLGKGAPSDNSNAYGVPGAVMNYGGTGAVGAPGTNLVQLTDQQGHTYTVNKAASTNFQGFLKELEGTGYKVTSLGGYSMRAKAGGGGGLSEHAYGLAIDINPGANPFRGNHTDLPKNIHDMAARYGLVWGGDWTDPKDPMHFQWGGPNAGTELALHRAHQAMAGTTNNNSSDNDHHNTTVGDVHVHVKPGATPYMISGAVSASLHDSLQAAQANNGLTP
jgi:hypothetical protein